MYNLIRCVFMCSMGLWADHAIASESFVHHVTVDISQQGFRSTNHDVFAYVNYADSPNDDGSLLAFYDNALWGNVLQPGDQMKYVVSFLPGQSYTYDPNLRNFFSFGFGGNGQLNALVLELSAGNVVFFTSPTKFCGNCTSLYLSNTFAYVLPTALEGTFDQFAVTLTAGPSPVTLTQANALLRAFPPTPPVVPSIPEPATWATLLAGFGLVGLASRSIRSKGRAPASMLA